MHLVLYENGSNLQDHRCLSRNNKLKHLRVKRLELQIQNLSIPAYFFLTAVKYYYPYRNSSFYSRTYLLVLVDHPIYLQASGWY